MNGYLGLREEIERFLSGVMEIIKNKMAAVVAPLCHFAGVL